MLRVSHRIAVLRGGRLVAELPARGADKALIAEAMVGRRVAPAVKRAHALGDVVCELPAAPPSTALQVRAGEVVAIAGVAGNGQQALAAALCGEHAPAGGGAVRVRGRPLPPRPRAFVRAGVARVPEDRQAVGLVGELPAWENALLERYAEPAFARWGVRRRAPALAHARTIVERFDVRGTEAAGLATPAAALSGGNQQKLILGRALLGAGDGRPPALIVADQPTWGLDVGAVAYVHQQLLDACAAGAAVVLISEDLDEIFALADRIAVIHAGVLTEAKPAREWTLAAIGLAMAGGDGGRPAAEPAHEA